MDRSFICHSSADAREAMQLALALEARDCPCWIAPRDIPVGSCYPHEIVEGIKGCQSLIILLSEPAVCSPHILRELELAASERKKIVPILISGVSLNNSFKFLLAGVQWIEVEMGDLKLLPGKIAAQILSGEGRRSPVARPRNKIVISAAVLSTMALMTAGGAWIANRSRSEAEPNKNSSQENTRVEQAPETVQLRIVDIPRKPEPEPEGVEAPPVAISVNESFPAGMWTCEIKSEHHIVWSLDFRMDDASIKASGIKAFVNGKKASKGEQATTLTLTGTREGNKVTGTYLEKSKKTFEGRFEFILGDDFRSFEGQLYTPSGAKSATFSGKSNS